MLQADVFEASNSLIEAKCGHTPNCARINALFTVSASFWNIGRVLLLRYPLYLLYISINEESLDVCYRNSHGYFTISERFTRKVCVLYVL